MWSRLLTVSSIEQIRDVITVQISWHKSLQSSFITLQETQNADNCLAQSGPVSQSVDHFNPSSLPLQTASSHHIIARPPSYTVHSPALGWWSSNHWFYHEFLLSITGALWLQLLAHPTNVLTYLLYLLLDSVQAQCVFSNIDGGKFHICTSLIFSGVVWNNNITSIIS